MNTRVRGALATGAAVLQCPQRHRRLFRRQEEGGPDAHADTSTDVGHARPPRRPNPQPQTHETRAGAGGESAHRRQAGRRAGHRRQDRRHRSRSPADQHRPGRRGLRRGGRRRSGSADRPVRHAQAGRRVRAQHPAQRPGTAAAVRPDHPGRVRRFAPVAAGAGQVQAAVLAPGQWPRLLPSRAALRRPRLHQPDPRPGQGVQGGQDRRRRAPGSSGTPSRPG